jgi:hypothetical protein
MILVHFEFFGRDEELEEVDNAWKEMANAAKGIELKGRFIPTQGRYHYTYLLKAKSLGAWEKGYDNYTWPPRDKSKLSRVSIEYYNEA